MKNKFYLYFIAYAVGAYAIINLLIFTFVPYAKLNNAQFWVSWAFMFVFNSIMTLFIGLEIRRKDPHDIRILPVTLILSFNIIYLTLGIIFTCLLPQIAYVVVVDICVAIVYFILALRLILAINYVRENDAYRRKKIAYIREMTTMIDSYVSLAPDVDMADEIKRLSSDFRYSDPMSHESLASSEEKLMEMVTSLEEIVRGGDNDKITSLIADIRRELKLRNAKSANLK